MSDPPEYECEECGYDLTALAVRAQATRCPECGRDYPWPPTPGRSPWPGPLAIALGMCGPTIGVLGIIAACLLLIGPYAIAFWPFVPIVWPFAALGGPAITASEVARRCVLRPRRRRVMWAMQLTGAAANISVTLIAVLLALNL